MIIRRAPNVYGNCKPAKHRDLLTGKLRPPIGSLEHQLHIAQNGYPPEPWSDETKLRLLATAADDPDFASALAAVLVGVSR